MQRLFLYEFYRDRAEIGFTLDKEQGAVSVNVFGAIEGAEVAIYGGFHRPRGGNVYDH